MLLSLPSPRPPSPPTPPPWTVKVGRQKKTDTEFANTLILDLPSSRTMRMNVTGINHPAYSTSSQHPKQCKSNTLTEYSNKKFYVFCEFLCVCICVCNKLHFSVCDFHEEFYSKGTVRIRKVFTESSWRFH